MRLTLRTLLAYLDDLLEPSQARDLGERIGESPFATSIVNKIQDVVRRRRIGAPEVSGPGSDPNPNLVAEYLDNTLSPGEVTELERICLESDPHLAEVAASHQILTLVLGKPVEVPTELREHMYSLGAVAPPADPAAGNGTARHVPKVAGVGSADIPRDLRPKSGEQDLLAHSPVLARNPSHWNRTLLFLVGAFILAGWGYLIVTDYFPGTNRFLAGPAHDASGIDPHDPDLLPPAEKIDPATEEDHSPNAPDRPEQDAAIAGPSPVILPDRSATDVPLDVEFHDDRQRLDSTAPVAIVPPAPIPPTTGTSSPVREDVSPSSPSTDENTVAAASPGAAGVSSSEPTANPSAVEPAAPLLQPFQIQEDGRDGVVLRHDATNSQWTVLPRRSLLFPGEEVAAPAPFEGRFTISDRDVVCDVLLRSGARIRWLAPDAQTRGGIEIDRGRVLLSRRPTDAGEASLRMAIQIRNDLWLCDLLDPNTVIAVEVIPVLPQSVGDLTGQSQYSGSLWLASGSARLTNQSTDEAVELTSGRGLLTFSPAPHATALEPSSSSTLPDWILSGGNEGSLARNLANKYAKEFSPDQPVSASIRPVVKDKLPRMSELATATLALTDHVPGLVDALSAPHEESRIAAINGLRTWLPRSEDHAAQLEVELQNRFRPDVAAALSRLLWGFSEQDARTKATSQELIEWLSNDEIAVRELAAYHIQQLTNRNFGYRADRRRDEREAAVKHWRDRLEKSGALLTE
ncbi:MAG: hypothetical protein KF861_02430 [Planctomycetaceae bacterium]|nr:hypothetical protein [Planctomycetaceae bacterium]